MNILFFISYIYLLSFFCLFVCFVLLIYLVSKESNISISYLRGPQIQDLKKFHQNKLKSYSNFVSS